MFVSGFISIIGMPNSGKSTFLNRVIEQKISIVSPRPQTTRTLIQGVLTRPDFQIVFIDTPGVQTPKNKLGEVMEKDVRRSLIDVDAIIVMVDVTRGLLDKEKDLIESVKNKAPVIVCLNKIDLVDREQVFKVIAEADKIDGIEEIVPISAGKGENLEKVVELLQKHLKEGPKYYPDDMVTDQPERVIAAEIIREKALHLLREELPHGIGVEINSIKDDPEDEERVHIMATIYTEKDSHKGMIIGKGGVLIKDIGTKARKDLQRLFEKRVYLELYVKVVKDWRNRVSALNDLGLIQK